MRVMVGRVEVGQGRKMILVRAQAEGCDDETLKMFGEYRRRTVHIKIDKDEAKRIAIAMLDETNYIEEEDIGCQPVNSAPPQPVSMVSTPADRGIWSGVKRAVSFFMRTPPGPSTASINISKRRQPLRR